MGKCKYCGNPAGFLRSKHSECEEQHQGGRQLIAIEVLRAIKDSGNFDNLERTISEIERSSFMSSSESKAHLVKGWENSVEQFLEDGILDTTEEQKLIKFKEHFALYQSDLDKNGALTKTIKAAILRDVLNGIVPQRMSAQ